ncbi:SDR family NAD(P)-dependent oxidoreductase [Psychromicrobium xiongbiense]|uniref:SDR family NAD(P)-dependent oxidoreductase n=1 Tax=Psychromicrobium xiongbiense TaxID=3051184 RepID=UPI0025569AC4|nr:SDR family NAD(P)-dependent oxidoreductase [Psychromicrobium sp. YIM S02556]
MTERALVTGATAGLGAEFAQQLASARIPLILVARNTDRLDTKAARLREEFGIDVETLSADLTTDDGAALVAARLASEQHPVSLLVNNAGFGLKNALDENPVEMEVEHLRIHTETPLRLMHAALPGMLRRGHGRIINVASVAGFIPRGTYGAAKAWLISVSRWANVHYGPRGVSVTAVCPGFVHTEFHSRLGASTEGIPGWMWLTPDQVVREALADARAGKAVSIPSRRYKALVFMSRWVPDRLSSAAGKRGR